MIMSIENVVQTLKEVGCNKQTIESYIEQEGNQKRQLTILYNQRKNSLKLCISIRKDWMISIF